MVNNRVFWAVQAAALAPEGSETYTAVHGVQSVGITTTFNLEQIFQLGELAIYENIEDIPDIEVTLEKVLDGYPLIYHLATRGFSADTLSGRSARKCGMALSIFGDTQDSASGTPVAEVNMSGLFVSSLSYTFPSEGSCTESVTLVGNDKLWKTSGFTFTGGFLNTDTPLALTSDLGGVQRRENVVFDTTGSVDVDANGQAEALDFTILPPDIDGISGSGVNGKTGDVFGAHISSISVSTDLGRTDVPELGRKGPYFRFVEFPVEVTCEIEALTTRGDFVDAGENLSLSSRSIRIYTKDTTFLNLGTNNKLASVTYGGGDTGGGQSTVTYSYSTFNDLIVTHDQDPG